MGIVRYMKKFFNKHFVHMHCHSEFSQFDGLTKLPRLVMEARKMGFPALALTDHGNIMGWIEFIKECQATKDNKDNPIPYAPIKPILGSEMYLSEKMDIGQNDEKTKKKFPKELQPNGRKGNKHLNLYAMNFEGYQNLCTLSQKSWTEGFYFDPRIDIEFLSKHSKGLMAGSACLKGTINSFLLEGKYDKAVNLCGIFKDLFGDNFFLEVMYHGFLEQKEIIPNIFKLSSELDIPVVATNDVHYIRKEQSEAQEVVMCMSTSRCIKDPTHLHHPYPEFYLKSAEEMGKIFKNSPQCIHNSFRMAEKIDIQDITKNLFGGMRLPKFSIPEKYKSSFDYLKELAEEGLKEIGWDKSPEHVEAFKKELEDVKVAMDNNNYDFSTYFLIVRDYIKKAREIGTFVACGRGCLSGDVKIIVNSKDKFKKIKDIKVGDEVIAKRGVYRKVIKTHKYNIDETMLNIKSYYGDFDGVTLTKDHKVLLEKRTFVDNYNKWSETTKKNRKICKDPIGDLEWVEASKIEKGDWVFVPSFPFDFNKKYNTNPILIDMGKKFSNGRDMVVEGNNVSEIRFIPNGGGIRNRKIFSRFCAIDEKFAWILGKFAADGWLRKGKHKDNVVGFAFNKKETDQLKKVKNVFKDRGLSSFHENYSKTKDLIQLNIKSKYVCKLFHFFFDRYDYSSRTKHIPDIIFQSNNNIISSFVNGIFDGDGCTIDKYRKYTYSSTSKVLTYQLRELLRSLNIPCSVIRDRRNDSFVLSTIKHPVLKYGVNCKPVSDKFYKDIKHCKFIKDGMLLRIRNIEEIEDVHEVYDLTVEKESNYLTSSFIVHNSGYASVLLRCLGVTYGVDPIEYGLIWERFLAFQDKQFILEKDFGYED